MTPEAMELRAALATIASCHLLLGDCRPILERYLEEARDFDSFGCIVDPTLWMKAERRQADAAIRPMIERTLAFLDAVEAAQGAVLVAAPHARIVGAGAASTGA